MTEESGLRKTKNVIHCTEATIDRLEPTNIRTFYYDDTEEGFCVLVRPSGKISFYHCFRFGGEFRRHRLGDYAERLIKKNGREIIVKKDQVIKEARRKAKVRNGELADKKDPDAEERQKRGELTVGELFERFVAEHLEKTAKPKSVASAKQLWRDYLARDLRKVKLSRVDLDLMKKVHKKIDKESQYQANRSLEVVSSMFSKAIEWGDAPTSWTDNPCKGLKVYKERPRKRYLKGDEVGRFFEELEKVSSPMLRDYFLMLLLTGARRSNVAAMKWQDLDLTGKKWTIEHDESKNDDDMQIALTVAAVDILKRRKEEAADLIQRVKARTLAPVPRMNRRQALTWHREARQAERADLFVFPSVGKTGHLVESKVAWAELKKRAGLKNFRLHDLRHTVGSWLAAGGASLFVIKKSLGHKSTAASARYVHMDLDPVREAMEAAEKKMRAVAELAQEEAKKVTPFDAKHDAGANAQTEAQKIVELRPKDQVASN